MKIGVISDTHIPHAAADLPDKVYKAFEDVELILHAGDLVNLSVLQKLNKLAKTEAVYGNMDDLEVVRTLPPKRIIEMGNYKIGMVHGSGAPFRLINTVKAEFPEKVDIIIFGHSHSPVNEWRGNILFFNPGSPTDKIFARYNSYGIITINEDIKGEIVRL